MGRVLLAVGVLCAVGLTGRSTAQNSSPNGAAMPGQVVGGYRGQVARVGKQAPAAAPQAGQPIAGNAFQQPYDPARPYDQLKGAGINTRNVLAPATGPDGKPVGAPDALDQLSAKIKAFFVRTPPPPRPNYAPGITRRTHERANQTWRRD